MLDYPINIITILILLIPTLVRLWTNYRQIEIKNQPFGKRGYFIQNLWTGGLILGVSLVDFYISPVQYYFQPVCLSIALFVLFFDETLNLLRSKPFGYYGEGSNDKSFLEELVVEYVPGPISLTFIRLWIFTVLAACYYSLSLIIS